ncbi:MAG: hypothetical protein IJ944_05765 [Clostridia bacterium]|nr:hypothetical protein [Clostridia bacterium]
MLRKNVVLIKKKRNENNKTKINSFFRTFFMVSVVITCVISVFLFSVVVDEKSKQVGFGIKDSAIGVVENDTDYVMNFFSKKVEINKENAQEKFEVALDFAVCFLHPVIRLVWQGIELIT